MKTPKRTYVTNFLEWGDEFQGRLSSGQQRAYARWKRKNRVKQLKRTIAILKHRLKDTEETLRLTQKITKCFIVKPDHWHHLDENGNELTRKQWRIKTKKEKAACHSENAENAKQGKLIYIDAEQLTARKEQA